MVWEKEKNTHENIASVEVIILIKSALGINVFVSYEPPGALSEYKICHKDHNYIVALSERS